MQYFSHFFPSLISQFLEFKFRLNPKFSLLLYFYSYYYYFKCANKDQIWCKGLFYVLLIICSLLYMVIIMLQWVWGKHIMSYTLFRLFTNWVLHSMEQNPGVVSELRRLCVRTDHPATRRGRSGSSGTNTILCAMSRTVHASVAAAGTHHSDWHLDRCQHSVNIVTYYIKLLYKIVQNSVLV
jgi:hypothetical protein